MNATRLIRTSLFAALLATSAACAVRSPSIGDLQYNPARYYDRTVSVEGVVTSSWGIPLVPLQVYRISDRTGELTVVSNHGRVPPKGARVRVDGKVTEFGTVGGRSLGLHLRERDVHVMRRW